MRERIAAWMRGSVGTSLLGAIATSAVLALIGPFGTYDSLSPGPRALYWFAVVGVNWLLVDLVTRQLTARVADRLPAPRITVPLLAAVLVLVPATAVVLAVNGAMMPARELSPIGLLWKVGLLLVAVGLIFTRVGSPSGEPSAPAGRATGPGGASTFRQRIPARLAGELLCLEQEDHYLRIHTSDGSDLIHCRMADAERELGPEEGLRVHRSWWVARTAVRDVARRGSRPCLRLVDGREVPVGKTYRRRLREAGWL